MLRRVTRTCCLVALLLVAACGKVELYSELREREANEMLALLLRAGIATEKVSGKAGIVALHVEARRVPDAMDLLNAAGLPRDRFANMGELFKKEGLISSPSEERVRYIYGMTQELSRTLTGIDGVLSARVHVVLPNNDPADRQTKPASAAVLIRHASAGIDAAVPKIKELVVNSIEGLLYERVSVVLVRADEPPPRAIASPAAPGSGGDPLLRWGLAGGLLASVAGNLVFAAILFRRRLGGRALTPVAL